MKACIILAAASLLFLSSCGSGSDGGGRLSLVFPPSVGENDTHDGIVRIPEAVDEDILVSLTSSDPYFLLAPSPVTIPAGQTQVSFTANAPGNAYLDFTQNLILTASHPEYESASINFELTDDESNQLVVTIPGNIGEEAAAASGTVALAGGALARQALVITIESDLPGSLAVDSSATIAAGANSTAFSIWAPDDANNDNEEEVTVTASRLQLIAGSAGITVNDNNDD